MFGLILCVAVALCFGFWGTGLVAMAGESKEWDHGYQHSWDRDRDRDGDQDGDRDGDRDDWKAHDMRLVGYNDLQGRPSYMPTVVKQGHRYILYTSQHVGTFLNPMTGNQEYDGTSILDVTDPHHPIYLVHLPSQYGPPNNEARHVRVCAGDDLPGKKYPGQFFMLRSSGQISHDIYLVTDPAHPKLISTPVTGLTYTHKESWDCQSGYAAMPASPPTDISPTWRGNITKIFNLSDPYHPVFIRDWGLVGQEPGSTGPIPPIVHMSIIYTDPQYGTRLYGGYATSNGALQIVDFAKLLDSAHQAPTAANILYAQLGYLKLATEFGGHTFFPVLHQPQPDYADNLNGKTQDFGIITTEATSNGCQSYRAMAQIVDINTPSQMQVVSSFFVPSIQGEKHFCQGDGRFGSHSASESYLPPFYERFNAVAHFAGGVHIMDYRNPFDLKDIAWYVPEINQNTQQNCATRGTVTTCSQIIQTNNAATDDRGYVYIVDRAGTGTHILELTGYAADALFHNAGAPK
jgi:hypothetical protein